MNRRQAQIEKLWAKVDEADAERQQVIEEKLLERAGEGNLSAYSTVHMTDEEKKTLKRLVRQGNLLKVEMPVYSGAGNRYKYIIPFKETEQERLERVRRMMAKAMGLKA